MKEIKLIQQAIVYQKRYVSERFGIKYINFKE